MGSCFFIAAGVHRYPRRCTNGPTILDGGQCRENCYHSQGSLRRQPPNPLPSDHWGVAILLRVLLMLMNRPWSVLNAATVSAKTNLCAAVSQTHDGGDFPTRMTDARWTRHRGCSPARVLLCASEQTAVTNSLSLTVGHKSIIPGRRIDGTSS